MAGLGFLKRGRAGCAPYATAIPTVSGVRQVGQLATGSHGTYLYSPTSYTYRWLRDGVAIEGATSLTYTYASDDAGHLVALGETPHNAAGAGEERISNEVQVVAAAVGAFPATQTITFRDETLGQSGGNDLGYTGSGTITFVSGQGTDWVITANKLCPSGTANVNRSTALVGPYTIVVTDGVDSSTVTVNILQHGATVATVAELRLAIQSSQRRWGDVIDMRPGVYNPAETRITVKRTTAPTQRAAGPVEPTRFYHAWETDSAAKAGWITVQPITAGTVELRFLELAIESYQNWGVRFTGIRMRRYLPSGSYTQGGSLYVNSFNGIRQYGALQFDNLDCLGSGRPDCRPSTNQNRMLGFFNNYYNGGQLACYASDSWIIDNEMENTSASGDCIRHALFKTPSTGIDCLIAFNFLHNKLGSTTNNHADGIQGQWTGSNAPGLPAGDVDGYYSVGNIIVRGNGSGIGTFDFEGEFDGDMPSTVRLKIVRAGAFVASDYANGLTASNAAPGSGLFNCGMVWDQSNGGVAGSGAPRVRYDNEGQPSDYITIKNCYAFTSPNLPDTSLDSVTGLPNHVPFGPIPNLTQSNNIWNASASLAADFDGAAYGSSLSSIAAIMAAWNPKAGGRMLPGGGAENIGPFGTGYINHVNKTATVPGVTLPYVPAYSA